MKKVLLAVCVAAIGAISSVQAAGGAVPCLATCFIGDSRIGLYMNEGKQIQTDDWIRFAGNYLVGSLGSIYSGYKSFEKTQKGTSFCVGYLWGQRAGSEFTTTKLRTKEVLMCIPVLNLYPCVSIPLEAFSGKTMSDVIKDEGLTR